jgi:opacity protein-like surface antigen
LETQAKNKKPSRHQEKKNMSRFLAASLLASGIALSGAAVSAQDWSGMYVGVYYGSDIGNALGSNLVGLQGGYNFDTGSGLIVGGEVDLAKALNAPGGLGSLVARAGFAAGENMMVYADGGFGRAATGINFIQAGIGAEFNVTSSFGVRAGVDWLNPTNNPAPTATVMKLGGTVSF